MMNFIITRTIDGLRMICSFPTSSQSWIFCQQAIFLRGLLYLRQSQKKAFVPPHLQECTNLGRRLGSIQNKSSGYLKYLSDDTHSDTRGLSNSTLIHCLVLWCTSNELFTQQNELLNILYQVEVVHDLGKLELFAQQENRPGDLDEITGRPLYPWPGTFRRFTTDQSSGWWCGENVAREWSSPMEVMDILEHRLRSVA